MKHLSPKERLEFVQHLELDRPKIKAGQPKTIVRDIPETPKITADDKANYVDDGSLVSFVAGLSSEDKTDVLNSVLLAQLAANKKHDRYAEPEAWYKSYHQILSTIGWVGQQDTFKEYKTTALKINVEKAVLEILGSLALGATAIALVTQALSALGNLSKHDSTFVLWDQSSHSLTTGNFQIAASEKSGTDVVLHLGTFYFTATQTDTHFLFFDFSTDDIRLSNSAMTMTLNKDLYAHVRNSVIRKLGDMADDLVGSL
jgi:hypothetical protein